MSRLVNFSHRLKRPTDEKLNKKISVDLFNLWRAFLKF